LNGQVNGGLPNPEGLGSLKEGLSHIIFRAKEIALYLHVTRTEPGSTGVGGMKVFEVQRWVVPVVVGGVHGVAKILVELEILGVTEGRYE
jgi:hypothetical protein